MSFTEVREMVRIRHQLRRLLAEGKRAEARHLVARLRELAQRDAVESREVEPEIARWEVALAA